MLIVGFLKKLMNSHEIRLLWVPVTTTRTCNRIVRSNRTFYSYTSSKPWPRPECTTLHTAPFSMPRERAGRRGEMRGLHWSLLPLRRSRELADWRGWRQICCRPLLVLLPPPFSSSHRVCFIAPSPHYPLRCRSWAASITWRCGVIQGGGSGGPWVVFGVRVWSA